MHDLRRRGRDDTVERAGSPEVGLRVAILNGGWAGGGAEAVTRCWADELERRGATVFCYGYQSDPGLAEHWSRPVVRFEPQARLAKAFLLPFWLRTRLAEDRVDVVVGALTYSNLALLVARFLGARARLVISEHSVSTLYARSFGVGRRVQHALAKRLYRFADAFIGVSQAVRTEAVLVFGLEPTRVAVLPNPVYRPTDLQPRPERPDTGELVVAFVGRLTTQKRPLLFVETLAELRSRGHAVRGVVLGEGEFAAPMQERARALGVDLDLLGWCDPWWRAADGAAVLLLPSSVEGFGNVLVEAAAAGIPSVAPAAALGVCDAVLGEVTGVLAADDSPAGLADAVLRAQRIRIDPEVVGPWLRSFAVEAAGDGLVDLIRRVV